MEIRNNSNLSFQARVSKATADYIKSEALRLDPRAKTMRAVRNKLAEISTWGSKDTAIELNYMDRNTKTISFSAPKGFVVTNNEARLSDEVQLPNKGKSLFQRFFRLTEEDVLNAEKELIANVAKSAKDDSSLFDLFV